MLQETSRLFSIAGQGYDFPATCARNASVFGVKKRKSGANCPKTQCVYI
jgi:hypothetical protein